MLPQDTSKTFLSFTPKRGNSAEQPVESDVFLSAFLDYGVWLRVAAAYSHLMVLQDKQADKVRRFGALAGFYQQLGLSVEDTLANLVTWSVWSIDSEQRIADLMERIVLRFSRPKSLVGDSYVNDVRRKLLSTTKKVDIYPREYLGQLLRQYSATLPQQFGIPWKRNPSVKLVPKNLEPYWRPLPEMIRGTVEPLTKPGGELLASCYNKIKHGPQVIFTNPIDACVARGYGREDAMGGMIDDITVRILLDGARTQETMEEQDSGDRIAPFLVDDVQNTRRLFFQVILHNSNTLHMLGTWIFNAKYQKVKRDFGVSDNFVQTLVEEQSRHFKDIFPLEKPFPLR